MEFGLYTLFRRGSGDPRLFRLLATLRSVRQGARAVPFWKESQELMQNTGNEEHTRGSGLTCPFGSEVRMSNPRHRVHCLEIGYSATTDTAEKRQEGFQQCTGLFFARKRSQLKK